MKKTIISCLALVCAVCACNKQIEIQEPAQNPVQKQIITARVNVASKVAYEENENDGTTYHGLNSTWEEGDKFLAIQDGETVVEFTLVSGAGESEAVFQAEAEDVTESTSWVAVLGNKAEAVSSEIHCSYMGQNGTLAGLDDCNYVKAEGTGLEPVFDFNGGEKLSYILRIKLPAGIKCIEYTPCGYSKVTSEKNEQIYYNTGDGNNDYSKTSTITLSDTSDEGSLVYISLPLLNYSRTLSTFASGEQYGNLKAGVIITLLNNNSDNADLSSGCVFENDIREKGGRIGTLDVTGLTLIHRVKPSEAVLFSKSGDIQCKLHTSALTQKASEVTTYWSPCNLGATKASEVGGYFAWGEYSTKATYTFPSYTLRHSTKSTNRNDMLSVEFKISGTKYGYSMSGSRYDAARVKWGQAWRLPHMIEAYAASSGACSRATLEGIDGVRFTNGGSSIFIPNSRYMDGDKLNDATTSMAKSYTSDNYDCARFWSGDQLNRSYNNAGWNEAYTFGNTNDTPTDYDYWRRVTYLGFPIRPVLASSVLK